MRWSSTLVAAAAAFAIASPLRAQAPSIASTSPQAVKPGETLDVTIRGGNLADVTGLSTSFPAETALAPDVPENGKKNDQVVYRVTVPVEVPVGVHGIRVVTPRGLSPLKLFVVDDLPSVAQVGNNTSQDAAQPLQLPVAVDGAVGNLSRHYFKFNVAAGQRISFEVLARRIGSPLDPMIRILDSAGRELEYSDDEAGLMSDAQMAYTFSQAGEYVLEVRDIRYQGSGNHRFRLRIGDFPCVSVPYPMSAKRGSEVSLSFAGQDVEGIEPAVLKAPEDPLLSWINVGAKRAGGQSSGFATLRIDDNDEFLETEPNNQPEQANRVALGANLNGRFEQPGDVDRFVFSAKKGQKFTFAGLTRRQGSPTDLYLRLLKADGAQVAVAEDSGPTDGAINYTFPEDGDYTLVAEDLHQRGGSRFAYHIAVSPNEPGFSLTAAATELNIPAGGTTSVTVNAARQGYGGPIQIEAVGLPTGAVSRPTVMGPGRNDVVLTVTGTPELQAGQLLPIRIVGRAKIGDGDMETTATIGDALKAANNAMPWPTHVLALASAAAAAPKPPLNLRIEPAQIVFGQNLSAKVKVIAERGEAIDEQITLAVTPAKNGLPANVTAAVKPIPKGQNEIEIVFSATDKAALGEFTANLVATHKKGNATVTQPVPGVGFTLAQAFSLSVEPSDAKVAVGGQSNLKVRIDRNPAFNAPVAVTFQNLPKGITVAAATIAADQSEVEIPLSAAQDAAQGAAGKVTVKGDATVGKAKFTATSAPFSITVE